jgi:hypothetical protein
MRSNALPPPGARKGIELQNLKLLFVADGLRTKEACLSHNDRLKSIPTTLSRSLLFAVYHTLLPSKLFRAPEQISYDGSYDIYSTTRRR